MSDFSRIPVYQLEVDLPWCGQHLRRRTVHGRRRRRHGVLQHLPHLPETKTNFTDTIKTVCFCSIGRADPGGQERPTVHREGAA